MSKSLENRIAIVTGASKGIGARTALELAKRGANVLITYNTGKEQAEGVLKELEQLGVEAIIVQATGSDREAPLRIVNAAVQKWGHIDIIINNAAIIIANPLKDLSHEILDKHLDNNFRFPSFLIKESLPYLGKSPRIVNVSSTAARMGGVHSTAYAASKAALEAATRVWALELGHEYGATVNIVNPGPVYTDMNKNVAPEVTAFWDPKIAETPAAPRYGTPDDIAQIVAFLAEEGSRWCTGSVVSSNGGMCFS